MRTYILDTLNRFNRFSQSLDAQTILCNKSWLVFNDSGEREVYIFQENGSILISVCGNVTSGTWQYISANNSVVITTNNQSVMAHPGFYDEIILALHLDGSQEIAFLIDENKSDSFSPRTLSEIKDYFEQKLIEENRQIELETQRRIDLAQQEAEEKRRNEELEKVYALREQILQPVRVLTFVISICGIIIAVALLFGIGEELSKRSLYDIIAPIIMALLCLFGIAIYLIIKWMQRKENRLIQKYKKQHPDDPLAQKL